MFRSKMVVAFVLIAVQSMIADIVEANLSGRLDIVLVLADGPKGASVERDAIVEAYKTFSQNVDVKNGAVQFGVVRTEQAANSPASVDPIKERVVQLLSSNNDDVQKALGDGWNTRDASVDNIEGDPNAQFDSISGEGYFLAMRAIDRYLFVGKDDGTRARIVIVPVFARPDADQRSVQVAEDMRKEKGVRFYAIIRDGDDGSIDEFSEELVGGDGTFEDPKLTTVDGNVDLATNLVVALDEIVAFITRDLCGKPMCFFENEPNSDEQKCVSVRMGDRKFLDDVQCKFESKTCEEQTCREMCDEKWPWRVCSEMECGEKINRTDANGIGANEPDVRNQLQKSCPTEKEERCECTTTTSSTSTTSTSAAATTASTTTSTTAPTDGSSTTTTKGPATPEKPTTTTTESEPSTATKGTESSKQPTTTTEASTKPSTPEPAAVKKPEDERDNTALIASLATVGGLILVAIVVGALVFIFVIKPRRAKRDEKAEPETDPEMPGEKGKTSITDQNEISERENLKKEESRPPPVPVKTAAPAPTPAVLDKAVTPSAPSKASGPPPTVSKAPGPPPTVSKAPGPPPTVSKASGPPAIGSEKKAPPSSTSASFSASVKRPGRLMPGRSVGVAADLPDFPSDRDASKKMSTKKM